MIRQTKAQAQKNFGPRPPNGLFPRLPVRTVKHEGRNDVLEYVRITGGLWNGSNPASSAVGFHHDFAQVAVDSPKAPVDENYTSTAGFLDPQYFSFGDAGQISSIMVQPKLKIGQPGDRYEQEADRLADQILRMPGSRISPQKEAFEPSRDLIGSVQEKAVHNSTPEMAPPSVQEVLRSPGRPLEPATRRFMEPRFGHDFSKVRVHADARAAASAQAVQAQAFTLGQEVVFGAGQYAPETMRGKRLLAHELTHVVQQSGGLHRKQVGATVAFFPTEDEEDQTQRNCDTSAATVSGKIGGKRYIQRDLAIEPPHPQATGEVLDVFDMDEAKDYNLRVVAVIGETGIRNLRDVLGISPDPPEVDDDFVNAVVWWQAMHGLDEDGMLGPRTARRLFLEIGAEDVGHGELVSGPTYRATTSLSPPVVGGIQNAAFRFEAEFADDPANELYASCCELRQFIRWDAAYAAAAPGGPPHGGFPAGAPPNTWIEDRNGTDRLRYGHRSGQWASFSSANEYIDINGNRNAAFGHIYRGGDFPMTHRNAGEWRFMVRVYDKCNNNRRLGDDLLLITWNP